ncbi:hypothetical protein DJ481_01530 [Enterobacter hormaechei]|nr:hypothetical protein EQ802_12330 [Enterobacter hormaechei]RTO42343.1 hypothetical protein EKN73_00110 [Enterobacter hormaechei]RTP70321.1 hypothetical protein EKN41_04580 [Enterobacter hormaechei]TYF25946.1 hypothetical protein DJ481_01530 [Enterobacter hormaechei]TYF31846.1 hypothetical protein DJ489_01510 [Enterobacter hormaechei]
MVTINGSVSHFHLRFYCVSCKCRQPVSLNQTSLRGSFVNRAGIRRCNPYHTRHTFACWFLPVAANPSFIANQMGHINAQMVYEIYATWIEEMNTKLTL